MIIIQGRVRAKSEYEAVAMIYDKHKNLTEPPRLSLAMKIGNLNWYEYTVCLDIKEANKKMREIKFRGKRLDNNEWAYGGIWINDTHTRQTIHIIDDGGTSHTVYGHTVAQYTNLEDRNKADIYGGDILEQTYINPMTKKPVKKLYKIVNKNGCYWAIAVDGWADTLAYFVNDKCKIIGNIEENPELLEGGDNGSSNKRNRY